MEVYLQAEDLVSFHDRISGRGVLAGLGSVGEDVEVLIVVLVLSVGKIEFRVGFLYPFVDGKRVYSLGV